MQQAFYYCEQNKQGLGIRFLDALEKQFKRVQKYPEHYQIKTKPYREALVTSFPYVIIFEIMESAVVVYAVFNTYLNPNKKP